MGQLDHLVTPYSVGGEASTLFSKVAILIYVPNNSSEGSIFSTDSAKLAGLFNDKYSEMLEMISHCS